MSNFTNVLTEHAAFCRFMKQPILKPFRNMQENSMNS